MKEYGLADTIQNPQTGKTVSQCERGREGLWQTGRQKIHPKGDDPQTSPMFRRPLCHFGFETSPAQRRSRRRIRHRVDRLLSTDHPQCR